MIASLLLEISFLIVMNFSSRSSTISLVSVDLLYFISLRVSFFVTHSESSSTISSNQSQESGYQSGPIQSTTYTSQNNAQGPLYEQRSTQTRRYPSSISSSPQKDLTQAKVVASQAPGHWLGNSGQSPFNTGKFILFDKWCETSQKC